MKADCEALRTELSRCKRYSNALAVRVKELREENGTLRKMNAEMNEVIHWLDDQCEMASQRIKALEGERNGDEGNKPTSKARNQRIAKMLANMPVPKFRAWLDEFSKQVFTIGVEESKEILHNEFGFGEKRLKRFDDALMELQRKIAERRDDG